MKHILFTSVLFLGAWNVSHRHGLDRRKHLCFNRIGSNYSVEACSSRHTCRECKQKHHTLLHRPASNSHSSNATASNVTDAQLPSVSQQPAASISTSLHVQTKNGEPDLSPAQFPVTALATMWAGSLARCVCILMDSGSSITLVTFCQFSQCPEDQILQKNTMYAGLYCCSFSCSEIDSRTSLW